MSNFLLVPNVFRCFLMFEMVEVFLLLTIHEDHKDYKCESCGKSFSEAGHLEKHIHPVHKNYKWTI